MRKTSKLSGSSARRSGGLRVFFISMTLLPAMNGAPAMNASGTAVCVHVCSRVRVHAHMRVRAHACGRVCTRACVHA